MIRLVIDGAEYSNGDQLVALYSSESGRLLASANQTPAGLLSCVLYEREEDLYFGNHWQQIKNPESLFTRLEDVEHHIRTIFESMGTFIRGTLPKQYVEFWGRNP